MTPDQLAYRNRILTGISLVNPDVETIVRSVAEMDPHVSGADDLRSYCIFCNSQDSRPAEHEAECAWRLAVQWVDGQARMVE